MPAWSFDMDDARAYAEEVMAEGVLCELIFAVAIQPQAKGRTIVRLVWVEEGLGTKVQKWAFSTTGKPLPKAWTVYAWAIPDPVPDPPWLTEPPEDEAEDDDERW